MLGRYSGQAMNSLVRCTIRHTAERLHAVRRLERLDEDCLPHARHSRGLLILVGLHFTAENRRTFDRRVDHTFHACVHPIGGFPVQMSLAPSRAEKPQHFVTRQIDVAGHHQLRRLGLMRP